MPRFSASAGLLLRAATATGLLCGAIILVAGQESGRVLVPKGVSASMAVEHRTRATPRLAIGNLRASARVTIANNDAETIAVSVPEAWMRAEVTGVPLKEVAQEAPAFGFIRWSLPQGGTIVFDAPKRIDHLELYNPSGIPMHVILRRTDILTDETEESTILVQESPTKLF